MIYTWHFCPLHSLVSAPVVHPHFVISPNIGGVRIVSSTSVAVDAWLTTIIGFSLSSCLHFEGG